jgi:hypothetical protein
MFNFLAHLFGTRKSNEAVIRHRRKPGKCKRRQYRKHPVLPVSKQVPHPDTPEKELLRHPWYRHQKGISTEDAMKVIHGKD